MGKIDKILANKNIPKKGMLNSRLIIEWCENIHLHYRDMRMEFDEEDFEQLAITMFDGYLKYKNIKKEKPKAIGNENKYHVLSQSTIEGAGEFADRLQIELQKEGHIHIHYRNLRLEMKKEDFLNIASAFIEAIDDGEE
jgi:hypothetical protein